MKRHQNTALRRKSEHVALSSARRIYSNGPYFRTPNIRQRQQRARARSLYGRRDYVLEFLQKIIPFEYAYVPDWESIPIETFESWMQNGPAASTIAASMIKDKIVESVDDIPAFAEYLTEYVQNTLQSMYFDKSIQMIRNENRVFYDYKYEKYVIKVDMFLESLVPIDKIEPDDAFVYVQRPVPPGIFVLIDEAALPVNTVLIDRYLGLSYPHFVTDPDKQIGHTFQKTIYDFFATNELEILDESLQPFWGHAGEVEMEHFPFPSEVLDRISRCLG
tara:strand:- start:456 stop:1283 length:828 start_codon:yes stop_codon:yes gene_type:complete